jgi:hypothetical protein
LQPKFAGRRHWYRLRYLRALACLRFPEREPGLFRLADSGRMDSLRASLVRPRTRSASPARSADATGKAAWSGFGRHRVPSRNDTGIAAPRAKPTGIDKSLLAIGKARRYRDKNHLKFVASRPCVFCGRKPSDPHHLRFAQPRALGKTTKGTTIPDISYANVSSARSQKP